ncbi:MAG TPA: tetratricopeptide repeat protein [Pyrinomonadaceae bacterium]|nr:tetratricopeptide repeat protein [Pyrinomonadaceae bacterium]
MRRKHFFISFVAVAMMLLSSLAVSAQTGQLFGEVSMKQADGTTAPAAGAQVDVYRTDLPGKYNTKTNKSGKFVFAGLPYTGTFIITVSAPNATPDIVGDVKAGREINYKLTLTPGDGKRLSETEAKSLGSAGGPAAGGSESEADKQKRLEVEAKNREIMVSNEKIKNANEVISRTAKAGNEFLKANKFDEAIAQYDEGIAADATHPGQPVLLTNRSIALAKRGVGRYNDSVKAADEASKTAGRESAIKDWRAAVDSAEKAVTFLKNESTPSDPGEQERYKTSKYLALLARADAYRLLAKFDSTQAETGFAAYGEYIAAETDPAKKVKAEVEAAEMLRSAGSWEKALAEFKRILETNPDNVDALRGAGLALFSSPNKSDYQEAANFLQRFVDKAPDTHPEKASAKEALDFLKTQENIKPQKTTTTTGGRRRG